MKVARLGTEAGAAAGWFEDCRQALLPRHGQPVVAAGSRTRRGRRSETHSAVDPEGLLCGGRVRSDRLRERLFCM